MGLRIDLPCGIVGGVQNDGTGLFMDGFPEVFHIRFKREVHGRNGNEFAAGVAHIEAVFHKIGTGRNDFLSGSQNCPEKDIDPPCRSAGDDHLIAADGVILFFGDHLRQFLPDCRESGIGHISHGEGLGRFLCNLFQRRADHSRRWHIRIAQAEIKNIFRAEFLFHFDSGFKHLADGR